jgi:hypothetical protein
LLVMCIGCARIIMSTRIACTFFRSVVGIHAADVLSVARHASTALGLAVRAVVSHEQTASAVLHAAVVSPSDVANVAVIGAVASYEMAAGSRLYDVRDDYAQVRRNVFTVLVAFVVVLLPCASASDVAAAVAAGGGAGAGAGVGGRIDLTLFSWQD